MWTAEPRLRLAALVLLLLQAALLPFARGGFSAEAQTAACALSALALALALAGTERPRAGLAWLAPALLALYALLQCAPLPAGLVRALAPVSWELRSLAPAPAQAFMPLTLDLPATLGSLTFAVGLSCAAAAAAILAAGHRLRPWLLAAPLLAALPQAATGLAQLAAGGSQLTGGFVNRNHAAALLSAGALVALGLSLERAKGREARIAVAALAAFCAACVAITGSRGGLLSLCAGCALLALLSRKRAKLVLLLLAAGAVVLVAALASRGGELAPGYILADEKLRSFAGAALVAHDHWLAGLGRGAYRFLSERHRSVPGDLLYVYVENEPLQLAAELGLPAALAVLSLSAWAFARGVRRTNAGLSRGAAAALFSLALHNLVDFNLELLGVALPAALALAALPPPATEAEPKRARPPWARACAIALALAATAGALAGQRFAELHSAEREAAAFALRASDPSIPLRALLEEARALLVLHPADPLLPLLAARALHERAPKEAGAALLWVNRALQLSPTSPRAHAMAAVVLASAGAGAQARLELRLALSGGRHAQLSGDLLALGAQLARGVEQLWEETPDDPGVRVSLVRRLHELGRRAEARELAERELQRLETLPEARALIDTRAPIESLLVRLAALAVDAGDAAQAERHASRLAREFPASCDAPEWISRAQRLAGRGAEADETLRRGLARCPQAAALALELVEEVARRRGPKEALAELQSSAAEAPSEPTAAEAHLLHARLLERMAEPAHALEQRWLAAQLAPERPQLALDYAERLLMQGERTAAVQALRSALRRAPPDAREPLQARLRAIERDAAPAPEDAPR